MATLTGNYLKPTSYMETGFGAPAPFTQPFTMFPQVATAPTGGFGQPAPTPVAPTPAPVAAPQIQQFDPVKSIEALAQATLSDPVGRANALSQLPSSNPLSQNAFATGFFNKTDHQSAGPTAKRQWAAMDKFNAAGRA